MSAAKKNVVVWSRVSTKEQAEEGYSIDAQKRKIEERAAKEGWHIVKEFGGAESAKKGAERKKFNEMMDWVASNARKLKIQGLVAHKLDRMARNMKDAVRLAELQEKHGVQLFFIENNFEPGPVGQFSYNVLSAVNQFYSDNLRTESLKGMSEKVEQGWLATHAPAGYLNDPKDENEPIKIDPVRSIIVRRMFELYRTRTMTFQAISDALLAQGLHYTESCPRFSINSISYILNNRFYIGELSWHGRVFPGKHRPLIDIRTFEECQDILKGKNRRTSQVNLPLAGGLFRCAHCGSAMAGELQRKGQKDGSIREHVYYRCCNRYKPEGHPVVGWKAEDLEAAIVAELRKLKLPNEEVTAWFRDTLRASLKDEVSFRKDIMCQLRRQETDLEAKKDRLLDAFLAGHVQKTDYEKKADSLRIEIERVRKQMAEDNQIHEDYSEMAVKVFDLTQKAAETWLGSCKSTRRELLEILCTNRELDELNLRLTWRKPFDAVAETAKEGYGVAEAPYY